MANTFDSDGVKLTTTAATTVFTAPSVTQTIIKSISAANISGSTTTIDIFVDRSGTNYYLIKGASLAAGAMLNVAISSAVVLRAADVLKAQAADANAVDVFVSYLKIT